MKHSILIVVAAAVIVGAVGEGMLLSHSHATPATTPINQQTHTISVAPIANTVLKKTMTQANSVMTPAIGVALIPHAPSTNAVPQNTLVKPTALVHTQQVKPQQSTVTPTKFSNTHVTIKGNASGLAGINVAKLISVAASDGLNPTVLKAALNSYAWANTHGKLGVNKDTLTVVDFNMPSYAKRLWVLNLKNDTVLMNTYTAHGKGSGGAYATKFSNVPQSKQSSLGIYVTGDEYVGKHDQSMRVRGLEASNSNAHSRDIVIHSAKYVAPQFIAAHHMAGRSWGCFAVSPTVKGQLLNDVRGGSALFAYATPENNDPIVTNGPLMV